jgi:hypothetical protein
MTDNQTTPESVPGQSFEQSANKMVFRGAGASWKIASVIAIPLLLIGFAGGSASGAVFAVLSFLVLFTTCLISDRYRVIFDSVTVRFGVFFRKSLTYAEIGDIKILNARSGRRIALVTTSGKKYFLWSGLPKTDQIISEIQSRVPSQKADADTPGQVKNHNGRKIH